MKLIEQLRNDTLDESVSLSSALRKSKVLASVLRNDELRRWVNGELDGYPEKNDLPDYRVQRIQSIGTFSGSFGRIVQNATIPTFSLEGALKEFAEMLYIVQGVRELEEWTTGKDSNIQLLWPAEALALYNREAHRTGMIDSDFALIEARRMLSVAVVKGILDTVRNRLLDFVLQLQEIDPNVIESEKALADIPKETVSNVFHYSIYGNNNIVASGHQVGQTVTQTVQKNDVNTLSRYFENLGASEKEITDLKEAVALDGSPANQSFGPNIKKWIASAMVKVMEGTWKVGLDVAPKLIENGLSNYYGWK